MRRTVIVLLITLFATAAGAQRLTRTFTNVSMADALATIAQLSQDYRVQFIYDELEDFTITTTIEDKDVPDAIRQVIGFYPVVMSVDGQNIFVECVRKERSKVSGTLVDEHSDPIPFASVSLLMPADSTFVTGGVSNEAGRFVIPCGVDEVLVRITRLGYRPLFVSAQTGDMGNIVLEAEGVGLDEVEVYAEMPRYTMTAEGIQTNVEGTVLAKLGTLEDVLEHVPGVTKTDSGWEVFARGSPLIYLNGRQVYELEELGMIKSEDVKSVEVVRNPGAKYAGTAGAVLNIKIVRSKGEGFSVDAHADYYFNKYHNTDAGLTINYSKDRFNAFISYYDVPLRHSFHDDTYEQTTYGRTLWTQHADYHQHDVNPIHLIEGGIYYNIGKEHSIGAKYMTIILGNDNYCSVKTDNTLYANGDFYDHVTSDQHRISEGKPQQNLNAYYNGKAGNTSIDFNMDYFRNDWTVSYPVNEQSDLYNSDGFSIYSSEISTMTATKLSLVTLLLGGSLSYGGEFINLNRRNIYESSRTDIIGSSHEKLTENTTSLYAEYAHPTPIGKLTLGVRYEHVGVKYYEEGKYVSDESRTYDNVFPNVRVEIPIGSTIWQLSYSARTARPTFTELSSNTSYNNRYFLQQGNPQLKNQTDHMAELSGVWRFMQLTLGYTDSRNAIVQFANQAEAGDAVTLLSWKNLPSIKRVYSSISAAPEVGIWSPQLALSLYKQWLTMQTDMGTCHLNKPMFSADVSNALNLPFGLMLNVDFSFIGKGHQWNCETMQNRYLLNVGLRKSFFNDALTFRIWGSDILHRNENAYLCYYDTMKDYFYSTNGSRRIILTLRYTFNQSKSQYKGTGAGSSVKDRL